MARSQHVCFSSNACQNNDGKNSPNTMSLMKVSKGTGYQSRYRNQQTPKEVKQSQSIKNYTLKELNEIWPSLGCICTVDNIRLGFLSPHSHLLPPCHLHPIYGNSWFGLLVYADKYDLDFFKQNRS